MTRTAERRGLVTGAYDKDDFGVLNLSNARSAVAVVITLGDINTKFYENYALIPPVIPVKQTFLLRRVLPMSLH